MSDPRPARVGRNGTRHAAACKPEHQHALVELHRLDGACLASDAEVRLERDRVERDEPVDRLADLARRTQQTDVGPAVADDGQVLRRRTQDLADDRHRLAPRRPASDADRHAVAQLD